MFRISSNSVAASTSALVAYYFAAMDSLSFAYQSKLAEKFPCPSGTGQQKIVALVKERISSDENKMKQFHKLYKSLTVSCN